MSHIGRAILCLVVGAIVWGLTTTSAKADPLTFSNVVVLQNNDTTRVDLFSHQSTTFIGPQLNFLVDISGTLPVGVENTLLVTYSEFGRPPVTQSFQIPLLGSVHPPFTLLFTFISPGANVQGVAATLTLDILGSSPDFVIPGGQSVNSYTYSLSVSQPVPEPTTIVLLGTGLVAASARIRRRRTR